MHTITERIPGGTKTLAALVLVFLITAVVGLNLYRNQNPIAIEVQTAEVTMEELGSTVYATGTIELVEKQEIYAPADRLVRQVHVKVGDKVTPGQIIAELEADTEALSLVDAQARLAEEEVTYQKSFAPTEIEKQIIQATYNSAEQSFQNSEKNLERIQTLYDADAVSLKELEEAQSLWAADHLTYLRAKKDFDTMINGPQGAELKSMEVNLHRAQEALRLAEENLAQFIVPARIEGEVMAVEIAAGDVTAPGAHMITIGNPEKLEVHLGIGEYDAARVKKDQEVVIEAAAFPDQDFRGKVLEVSQKAKINTSSQSQQVEIPVKIAVDTATPGLLPGFTVDVKITTLKTENRLVIPYEALVEKDNESYVFIIKEGKAAKIDVTAGLKGDLYIEITAGLEKGDIVILEPGETLEEGQAVKPAKNTPVADEVKA